MISRAEFRARVADRPLLFDGATGTVLQSRRTGPGHGFDGLNLTTPDVVGAAHRAYIAAGATTKMGIAATALMCCASGLMLYVDRDRFAALRTR